MYSKLMRFDAIKIAVRLMPENIGRYKCELMLSALSNALRVVSLAVSLPRFTDNSGIRISLNFCLPQIEFHRKSYGFSEL